LDVPRDRCHQARAAGDRRAAVMRILCRRAHRYRLLKELGVTVDQRRPPKSTYGGTVARTWGTLRVERHPAHDAGEAA